MNYKRKFNSLFKQNNFLFFINNFLRVIRDYLIFRKLKYDVLTEAETFLIDFGPKTSVFCGYYDISPFNEKNDELILIHSVIQNSFLKPNNNLECSLVLYNRSSKKNVFLGKTRCWNWQQGARLGWIDESRVIYNDYDSDSDMYFSKIVNVNNCEVITNNFPVMSWYSLNYFCSLDFKRLNRNNQEYGYSCHKQGIEIGFDGLSIYNFNGKSIFSKSIYELLDFLKLDYQLSKVCYINHPLFSPNGSKMIFLFRYFTNGRKYHHLFMWEEKKNDLTYLGEFLVSHYCWKNNDEFLFWGEGLGTRRGYSIFSTVTGLILDNFFLDYPDGHPVLLNDVDFLFDTYNSRQGKQLNICSSLEKKVTKLMTLREFPSWSYFSRCDFHPSISSSKSVIQGDVNFNGYRKVLLLMNLDMTNSDN